MIEYSGKTVQSSAEAVTGKLCYIGSSVSGSSDSARILIWNGTCSIDEGLMYTTVALVIPSGIDSEKIRYAKKIAEFYRIPAMKINIDEYGHTLLADDKIAILDPQAQKLFINPNLETISYYFSTNPRKFTSSPTLLLNCPSNSPHTSNGFDGIVISPTTSCNEEHLYENLCDIADANTGTRIIVNIPFDSDGSKFTVSVRALYRASVWGRFSLLCSNVGTPAEARSCVSLMHSEFSRLDKEEREFNGFIPKGLRIETPLMLLSKPCHRLFDFFCLDYPRLLQGFTNSSAEDGWEYISKYVVAFAKNAGLSKIALSTDRSLPKGFAEFITKENVISEMYVPRAMAMGEFSYN